MAMANHTPQNDIDGNSRNASGAGESVRQIASLSDLVAREAFVYLTELPRQLSHPNLIRMFGFKPGRTAAQEETFDRFGFAFVTGGSGYLIADGRRWPVQAPCMMFHQPGHHYRIVPAPAWDEMYITYDEEANAYFMAEPWTLFNAPVMQFSDTAFMLERARQLLALLPCIRDYGVSDRADQTAEALLLDALIQRHTEIPEIAHDDEQARRMHRARTWVDKHFRETVDVRKLAAAHGFSERHFRRLWHQYFGDSVRAHVQERRLHQAVYLLRHSDLRVNEIADALGYGRASYFIRQFTRHLGCSPTQYRRQTV